MNTKNTGGPAFPELDSSTEDRDGQTNYYSDGGMTLRDYFAAKALAALITVPKDDVKRGAAGVPILAQYAYEYADAMLAEREKAGG